MFAVAETTEPLRLRRAAWTVQLLAFLFSVSTLLSCGEPAAITLLYECHDLNAFPRQPF